jgi:hypothetical protein
MYPNKYIGVSTVHFNPPLLWRCNFNNFNNFVTLAKHKFKIPEDNADVLKHVAVLDISRKFGLDSTGFRCGHTGGFTAVSNEPSVKAVRFTSFKIQSFLHFFLVIFMTDLDDRQS